MQARRPGVQDHLTRPVRRSEVVRLVVRDDRRAVLGAVPGEHDAEVFGHELHVDVDLLQVCLNLLRDRLVGDSHGRWTRAVLEWETEAARKASLLEQLPGLL